MPIIIARKGRPCRIFSTRGQNACLGWHGAEFRMRDIIIDRGKGPNKWIRVRNLSQKLTNDDCLALLPRQYQIRMEQIAGKAMVKPNPQARLANY